MALNEIGPSSRERLTTLAKSIGREEFAMNVLEIPDENVLDQLADELSKLYDMRTVNENEDSDNNRVPEAALILPRGKEVILQAEEQDYKRGLKVTLLESGGYKVKYWYGDDVKTYPVEVEVDGVSIKKDAREVDILFHPELKENVAPNHNGKSSPFGSGYKKAVIESLRDWFKKEDWVRINTSGNIAGPCGTMKKGKPTTRCLPRKKAQSLTKAERKATVAKKVRGSKKGKQFVKNTKKSEFKKKK